jgi:hypothetical protein
MRIAPVGFSAGATSTQEWLYGRFLVFGRTLIIEAGGRMRGGAVRRAKLAAPLLARMTLREMAHDGNI